MGVEFQKGEILEGRYRIGDRLGGGGFGTVYSAEELFEGLDVRQVALKIYTPEVTERGDVESMFADCSFPARILASAASDEVKRHFVQIYSWGKLTTSQGICAYVAMELVRGAETLDELIRSGIRPTEEDVMEKMRQFFTALSAAHKADVLHRDIKGANVMLSGKVLKVVDFGVGARMSYGNVPLRTTLSLYTPESFEGRYTKASDIYQAGLLFYQYWTGAQPFEQEIPQREGESEGDYHQRLMLELRDMRVKWKYQPGSDMIGMKPSEKLDAILSKCLKFSDAERYQSADEVLKALERESLSYAEEVYKNGYADFAEEIARRLLGDRKTKDEDRVGLYRLLGDIEKDRQHYKEAKDHYLEAYKLAEKTGVYFLLKPQMCSLLQELVSCYENLGQKGSAGLYRKKIDRYQ